MKNGKDKECKSGEKQRFRCKKCNRRFGDNLGFERRQTAAVFITPALLLNGMGLGPFRIRVVLKHMNVDVHVDTIARWLEYYVGLVEKYASPIRPPNPGSGFGADEKRRDVKGEENYFVMAMCIDTRFIPAWCTTACKQSHDATKLLKAAMAKAGKPYPILITDGLAGYHTAFKNVFGSLKGFFMHSNQKKDPNNSRIDIRSPCLTIPGRKSHMAGSPIRLAPEGSAPAEMPKMRPCMVNST